MTEQETRNELETLLDSEAIFEEVLGQWQEFYEAEVAYYPDLYSAKRFSSELGPIEYHRQHWHSRLTEVRRQIRELQSQLSGE